MSLVSVHRCSSSQDYLDKDLEGAQIVVHENVITLERGSRVRQDTVRCNHLSCIHASSDQVLIASFGPRYAEITSASDPLRCSESLVTTRSTWWLYAENIITRLIGSETVVSISIDGK